MTLYDVYGNYYLTDSVTFTAMKTAACTSILTSWIIFTDILRFA